MVTIDLIIAKFTNLLVKKIDEGLLKELVFILLIFRKSLNCWYSKHHDKSESSNQEFTKTSLGMRMLEHANEFILCFFDYYAKDYRYLIKNPCFIGRKER